MKIKWSGIGIVAGRGKVGGSIAARNGGGAYVRNFAVPTNPQSAAQQFVRALFGALAAAWRSLSQDVRDAWNAAKDNFPQTDVFGDRQTLSGFNLYMKLNQVRQLLGLDVLEVPPRPGSPQIVESFALGALSVGDIEADILPAVTGSEGGFLVYATPGLSPGINSAGTNYRLITTIGANSPANVSLQPAYVSVFGDPVVGTRVFVRFVPVNVATGQAGTPFEFTGIVEP